MPLTLTLTTDPLRNGQVLMQQGAQSAGGREVYLYGLGPIGQFGAEMTYFLTDGTGTVRQTVSATGTVTLARTYAPFGAVLRETNNDTGMLGYLGALRQQATGLLYGLGRVYDPATGRFLTRGAWQSNPWQPQTQNPYVPNWSLLGSLLLAAPLAVIGVVTTRKNRPRNTWQVWLILALVALMLVIASLACNAPPPTGTPTSTALPGGPPPGGTPLPTATPRPTVTPPPTVVPPPTQTPCPPGGGGSSATWTSPFGEGIGYLKGYRYVSGVHNGIDLVSANDPFAQAGQVQCNSSGCLYINGATAPDYDTYSDVSGRQVVAVADGNITWVAPKGTDGNTSLINFEYTADGKTYWVQYTHVNASLSPGAVGKNTTLGWYGPYGSFGGVMHLHLTFKVDGVLSDPESYLP